MYDEFGMYYDQGFDDGYDTAQAQAVAILNKEINSTQLSDLHALLERIRDTIDHMGDF